VIRRVAASSSTLSLEGLGATKLTAERRTYGRIKEMYELRDNLQEETLMATKRLWYSTVWGNAQDVGKGCRVMCMVSTCGVAGITAARKMMHRLGKSCALKGASTV
jgi:hypothetical protein